MIPKTKIIATLGPASSSLAVLRKMFTGGLDIVRLNFSHGTHADHIERINNIRSLNKRLRRHIRIMQDLEGYRIRVGRIKNPLELKKRRLLYLTQKETEDGDREVSFDYEGPLDVIKKDALIYIDDGKIILKVRGQQKNKLKTEVVVPGVLKSHKGINILGVSLPFSALTSKDLEDLEVGVKYKLDYMAQSFVRNARDLKLLKSMVMPRHSLCKFFAKVENQEALKNLDEIIDEADGIIVARGDLGICVPIYKVPLIQKEIIKRCLKKRKPVAVATQMLDSMTTEELPTRAEVSDVANAILDGASHLLLSQETAIGLHPDNVINMMNEIIKNTENYPNQ